MGTKAQQMFATNVWQHVASEFLLSRSDSNPLAWQQNVRAIQQQMRNAYTATCCYTLRMFGSSFVIISLTIGERE